jgi:hypothetical protein
VKDEMRQLKITVSTLEEKFTAWKVKVDNWRLP